METVFQDLVYKVIDEQGIDILEQSGRCKILLYSLAKGGFKKEIRAFLHSLELRAYAEMLAASELEPLKVHLIQQLQDEYMLEPEEARESIGLLEKIVLEQKETGGSRIAELERYALTGDYSAQYALGLLFEKLRRYPEAIHWFKEAAKSREPPAPQTEPPPPPRAETNPENPPEEPKPEEPIIAIESLPEKNPDCPKGFVRIPAGTFTMGSPECEPERIDNEIPHEITIEEFYLGAYAVTQQEYERYNDMNPSHFKGPKLPVENVNWYEAIAYCNARSTKEGRMPAYTSKGDIIRLNRTADGYRLPTEAEWEYACRAGTATPFNTGTAITTDQANFDGTYPYSDCPKGTYREKTTPVGSFPPNPWGLYDMHGNVWEWCWDWFERYDLRRTDNPIGPSCGTSRVIRGGSWGGGARYLRAAYRCGSGPFARDNYLGFRVALPIF
ncbi:MAG: formylglycine-generating enzyme family protein [Spirochaetaceae bacterium]|jgi:formylglycine-generating enzyme required for sulfatase activity|nr:formylglycine-generating enzyme family protein [Spirochaetaceae bacterium]